MSTEAILGFGVAFIVFIVFMSLIVHEFRSIGKRTLPDKTTEIDTPPE